VGLVGLPTEMSLRDLLVEELKRRGVARVLEEQKRPQNRGYF
jgi:hypothetical protein